MNNTLVEKTSNLLSELPEEDLNLVYELVKKLVRSWDPDFTKLNPEEKERVDRSDEEMKAGIYYTEDEVWD